MTDRLPIASSPLGEWHGWEDFFQRDPVAKINHEQQQRLHNAAAARQLLGYAHHMVQGHGTQVYAEWRLTGADHTAGLPAALVERARQAAAAEDAARAALREAARKANDWIAKHAPADGQTHPLLSAAYSEARTAHIKAEQAATTELAELGRVAALVMQARDVVASESSRRAEVERTAQASHAAITEDIDQARRTLAEFGV